MPTQEQGKYGPLNQWLLSQRSQGLNRVSVSFEQIEARLGDKLPASARRHRAWWGNEANPRHVQAQAWINAGWTVEEVDQARGQVTFRRQ
jgi:hypothetical protein